MTTKFLESNHELLPLESSSSVLMFWPCFAFLISYIKNVRCCSNLGLNITGHASYLIIISSI